MFAVLVPSVPAEAVVNLFTSALAAVYAAMKGAFALLWLAASAALAFAASLNGVQVVVAVASAASAATKSASASLSYLAAFSHILLSP